MDGLYEELCARCPKELRASNGRCDVRVGPTTIFRPDIHVSFRRPRDAPRVLVVEALPDHGRRGRTLELETKRNGYRSLGIASYWVVDPGTSSVAVYEINYRK